jgi:hypothetical protein
MKTKRKPKGAPMGARTFLSAFVSAWAWGADKNVRAPYEQELRDKAPGGLHIREN